MNMLQSNAKTFLTLALLLFVGTLPTYAYNNVWVRAEAYPTGAGTVYVNWNNDPEDVVYDDASEFKRSVNAGASTAYVHTQVEDGYQLAGFARDNGNQRYDNGVDVQVRVNPEGLFTAEYDHTEYGGAGSSSAAEAEAQAALEEMANPTDYIFAVFTQGDVARPAEGQEWCGWVYCDKLDNAPGDEITIDAYGDSDNRESPTKFYKFDHWSDESGTVISTERVLKVSVQGGAKYYANFVETDKETYNASEKNLNPHKETAILAPLASGQSSHKFYDLTGRPLKRENAPRGIYIHNGNKIVKK